MRVPSAMCLPSTVKADKKAAQEKMIQQEHERQVREGGTGWGDPKAASLAIPHGYLCCRSGKTSCEPWPARSG